MSQVNLMCRWDCAGVGGGSGVLSKERNCLVRYWTKCPTTFGHSELLIQFRESIGRGQLELFGQFRESGLIFYWPRQFRLGRGVRLRLPNKGLESSLTWCGGWDSRLLPVKSSYNVYLQLITADYSFDLLDMLEVTCSPRLDIFPDCNTFSRLNPDAPCLVIGLAHCKCPGTH